MKTAERLSLGIATLALVVSSLGFFFQYWYSPLEVFVYLQDHREMIPEEGKFKFRATFVNSGKIQTAITKAILLRITDEQFDSAGARSRREERIGHQDVAFSLLPGEVKQLTLVGEIHDMNLMLPNENDILSVYVVFELVTGDGRNIVSERELMRIVKNEEGYSYQGLYGRHNLQVPAVVRIGN